MRRGFPLEKQFITHSSQEDEACHATQGHTGKHLGQSGGRRRREHGYESLLCKKEWAS